MWKKPVKLQWLQWLLVFENWPSGAYMIFQHQKFKISFDRKSCVIDNNAPFRFYTVYPKSLCHMYLLMYVGNTIHISPIFSVCASNFLNRYFVNAICICVYFFQDLSMVGIFFTSPHFINFIDVAPKIQIISLLIHFLDISSKTILIKFFRLDKSRGEYDTSMLIT